MVSQIIKSDCCGCGTCQFICPTKCISFTEDEEGFRYPNVNTQHCINCGQCENTCPIINIQPHINQNLACYAVKHKNTEVRISSSSGGLFSAIAEFVLNRNGVVFGVAFCTRCDHWRKHADSQC